MTKPSAELKSIWNKKLAESGFIDIEEEIKGERVLKQRASNCYRSSNLVEKSAKLQYFLMIGNNINKTKFTNETEKKILLAYSEGVKRAVIEKSVNIERRTIYDIIYKYLRLWGMKPYK